MRGTRQAPRGIPGSDRPDEAGGETSPGGPTAYYNVFRTAAGWVGLVTSDVGITRCTLPLEEPDECVAQLDLRPRVAVPDSGRLSWLIDRLSRYFKGYAEDFSDVEVDVLDASEFYRDAWDACRTIPRGETRTYGWLARMTGRPKAARAVGQAMARNPVPVIVPCHRVVGGDGSLRGFGQGQKYIHVKRSLLSMEGARRQLL